MWWRGRIRIYDLFCPWRVFLSQLYILLYKLIFIVTSGRGVSHIFNRNYIIKGSCLSSFQRSILTGSNLRCQKVEKFKKSPIQTSGGGPHVKFPTMRAAPGIVSGCYEACDGSAVVARHSPRSVRHQDFRSTPFSRVVAPPGPRHNKKGRNQGLTWGNKKTSRPRFVLTRAWLGHPDSLGDGSTLLSVARIPATNRHMPILGPWTPPPPPLSQTEGRSAGTLNVCLVSLRGNGHASHLGVPFRSEGPRVSHPRCAPFIADRDDKAVPLWCGEIYVLPRLR